MGGRGDFKGAAPAAGFRHDEVIPFAKGKGWEGSSPGPRGGA